MRIILTALLGSVAALAATPAAAIDFVNALAIAGDRTDLSGLANDPNGNRLGGFGSDLVRVGDRFYGLTDRGAGGGTYDYAPRIQVFTLDQAANGAAIGLNLVGTIMLTNTDGQPAFTGRKPGDRRVLGTSIDPEGLAIDKQGFIYVSDEYAPVVRKFDSSGKLVKTFEVPANLVPKRSDGSIDYNGDRDSAKTGRQDNRGFEGLTLSNDGSKAYAMLQDPLFEEGASGQGRRGQYVRIVEFDTATGKQTAQYAYQLESVAAVNDRLAAGQKLNDPNQQGRKIGISSLQMLPNGKLAVLERDGRGLGTDEDYLTAGLRDIGSKRVYLIDLAGATDIKRVTLTNGVLPAGVRTVSKSAAPWLDILDKVGKGLMVEKLEGISFGKMNANGTRNFFVLSDNDYSVTQNGSGTQFNICFDASGQNYVQVGLSDACPTGYALLPTMLYTFRLNKTEAAALGFAVPEPATWVSMIAGFGLVGGAMRRRRRALTA